MRCLEGLGLGLGRLERECEQEWTRERAGLGLLLRACLELRAV